MKQEARIFIVIILACFPCFITAQNNTGGIENGFIFDEAENFIEDMARVKFDGKYGFINNFGQLKVPLIYDECGYFSNGFVSVKKNGKWGFVNKEGTVIVPIKYDKVGKFVEGRASVKINEKWGFVDSSGREVISPQYDYIRGFLSFDSGFDHEFKNGYSVVTKSDEKGAVTQGLIDKNGSMIIPFYKFFLLNDYCEGLIRVCQPVMENGKEVRKYGFINLQGETVIPFKYESAGNFSDGLAYVKLNGKEGFIDKSGRTVIPFKYDSALGFDHGLAWVKLDGKTGYINKQGIEVIPVGKYSDYGAGSMGGDGYKSAKLNGKYGVVDKTGKVLVPFKYDKINSFTDGVSCVQLNGKWGAIDRYGQIVLPIKYEDVGFRAFSSGYTMVKLGGKCSYIDRQGKLLEFDLGVDADYKIGETLDNRLNDEGLSDAEKQKLRKAAFSWFKKGALKDEPRCCYAMGFYYRNGIIVDKNYAEAVKWFTKATKIQNPNGVAHRDLGYCYNEGGYGIVKDDAKAFNYFLEGAKYNHIDCYYALAVSYLNGIGCTKNPKTACDYADKLYKSNRANYASIYASCYNALAYDFAYKKEYTEALNTIDKAISANTDPRETANYCDSKGEIYLMMGKETEALQMWKKVMELDADNLNFYKEHSELYKQLSAKGKI